MSYKTNEEVDKEFDEKFKVDYELDGTIIFNIDNGKDYQTIKNGLKDIKSFIFSLRLDDKKQNREELLNEIDVWAEKLECCCGGIMDGTERCFKTNLQAFIKSKKIQ